MGVFLGFVQLEDTLAATVQIVSSGTPINTDALPTYRVYGSSGLLSGGSGTMSFKDTASLTAASNANPISVTSASHGLTSGTRVTITGVGGNTAANGTFTITLVNANTFTLNGSTGNGSYTSGGTWNVTGLYTVTLTCGASGGYLAGETFSLLVQGAISSTAYADLSTLVVT